MRQIVPATNEKRARLTRTLFVVLMIAAAIMGTIFSHTIVDRFSLKIDMTENRLYELGPTTFEVASSLQSPVEITVLNSEEDYPIMLRHVLKEYGELSSLITVQFVDPFENPVLLDYFRQKGLTVELNDIVVEGVYRATSYSIEDLYVMNAARTAIEGLNAEHQLTSALVSVNQSVASRVGFTDGHGERPATSLIELFERNNLDVIRGTVSRIVGEEPAIIVIASPTRDFRTEELEELNAYLSRGGALMVFSGPSLRPMESLETFLANWGIVLGNELVLETEGFTGNNPANIVPMYAPHEINRYFAGNRVFLTMPSSRSLYKNADIGSAYDVRGVLVSTPDSYGKAGYQFESPARTESDISGPFYLALTSERVVSVAEGEDTARVFVVGSRNMYADDLLGFSSYGNADFLVQAVNWLQERELAIFIPSKNIQPAPLNIISSQALILGIVLTVPLPVMLLLFGLFVIVRRRRLK